MFESFQSKPARRTWRGQLPRFGAPIGGLRDVRALKPIAATGLQETKKLLFVVNTDWFFVSHRLPIALEALKQGYEVHVATPITDQLEAMRSHGLLVHPILMGRRSMSPASEIRTFLQLLELFREVRPHVVHLVTPKPVLYGGIAARLAGVPAVVAAVSGLGFVFIAKGARAAVVRFLVRGMYRLALGARNLKVVVQNGDDRASVARAASLKSERMRTIPGSGVDLSAYAPAPPPPGVPVVVMAARLLRDKGVREFVAAARVLKARGARVRFQLLGDADAGNPTTIGVDELSAWRTTGDVELMGHRTDIAGVFARAHVVALPSYREGLPKVLIEAAACGRAVVTTDVPGCRDAIEPNVTGLLVPPRDAVALAGAIERLVLDAELRERMGRAGRQLAERKFGIERVVSAHLEVYRELMEASARASVTRARRTRAFTRSGATVGPTPGPAGTVH
jgi:glycosyltransferase involved in cell wall biosynthesis